MMQKREAILHITPWNPGTFLLPARVPEHRVTTVIRPIPTPFCMSSMHHHDVFSAKRAASLDTRLRRFLYRPDQLAKRYVNPGDRVLDFGCGPGFFTREFARRAGERGQVFSVDLQEEMLGILRGKLEPEGLMPGIHTHRCKPDSLDLPPELMGTFDVAFTIFVVHEVPDPANLFREISLLLKPGGTLYYTEPPMVVSGKEFRGNLALAEMAGFRQAARFFYFVNRAAVLKKV
jgi:SAM-dependent methyltransferase